VVSRARGVLTELENKHIQKTKIHKDQIGMFIDNNRAPGGLDPATKEMLQEIKDIDLNNMTPIEVMQKLHEIKKKSSQ